VRGCGLGGLESRRNFSHPRSVGIIRKISHVLAALVNNASDFKRHWNQDTPPPAVANGLQGRWQGEWISEANGHRGALRCLLTRSAAGDYSAAFHAVYARILRVSYVVPLHGQWSDGTLKLEGEADLGPLAGGIYRYQGQAAETEFVCTYRCKYDHGAFRMKPAEREEPNRGPQRRYLAIGLLMAAVLACGAIAYSVVSQRPPESYYQGRSASSWLRDFFGPNGGAPQALEAFVKMGTNAEPVLVAALRAGENPFVRVYRGLCARMPGAIQQHLPKPDDPALMRMAAVIVLQHSASSQIISNLYPMLKEPDSGVRLAVLQAVDNRIPDASQMPLLVLAGNDPDPYLRSEVWRRLNQLGASAASAAPSVLTLCADNNVDVRQDAAWTLWKITGRTNTAVPVLEDALSRNQDAGRRHLAAYHLLIMGDSNPFLVTTLVDSLTNSQAADRATVCLFLGEIGPPAAAAVPALRKALHDPEAEVRRRAEVALSLIDPQRK
jgi:HEAT repeat protein